MSSAATATGGVTLAVRNRQAQGFALIDLIFVCGIIGLLASIALPNLLQARQAAGASSAIGSMRAINSAELTFALTCGIRILRAVAHGSRYGAAGKHRAVHRPAGSASGHGDQVDLRDSAYRHAICRTRRPRATAWRKARPARASKPPRTRRTPPARASSRRAPARLIYENTASLWIDMPEVGEPPIGHPLR